MYVNLDERKIRNRNIFSKSSLILDDGLLFKIPIKENSRYLIKNSLNIFLYENLVNFNKNKKYILSENILETYSDDIKNLPNITHNGLILPKNENLFSYNMLFSSIVDQFVSLDIINHIDKIQFPINIRLQDGTPNSIKDSRPRSTTKLHTDIWSGDTGFLAILAILGDTNKAGIDFHLQDNFKKKYVQTLDDYEIGESLVKNTRQIIKLNKQGWFIADSYVLHQTKKKGNALRVSIDFRFTPKLKIDSDIQATKERDKFFLDKDTWLQIGKKKLIHTNDNFSTIRDRDKKYNTGYMVDINLIDL